jgi:hypothetical protein
MDMRNGQRVATDSITFCGQPFRVILPNQSHKHLGMRMAIDGNFLAEKEHVLSDMSQRLKADNQFSPLFRLFHFPTF